MVSPGAGMVCIYLSTPVMTNGFIASLDHPRPPPRTKPFPLQRPSAPSPHRGFSYFCLSSAFMFLTSMRLCFSTENQYPTAMYSVLSVGFFPCGFDPCSRDTRNTLLSYSYTIFCPHPPPSLTNTLPSSPIVNSLAALCCPHCCLSLPTPLQHISVKI
jgi:hypothetical protein